MAALGILLLPLLASAAMMEESCTDENQHCPAWARSGYCNKTGYESYMRKSCLHSCFHCCPPDTSPHCDYYKDQGFCESETYAAFMKQSCPQSCSGCCRAAEYSCLLPKLQRRVGELEEAGAALGRRVDNSTREVARLRQEAVDREADIDRELAGIRSKLTACCVAGAGAGTGCPKCGIRREGDRVVGGQDTAVNEYPWMALLLITRAADPLRQIQCGGTLINSRWVVTALHCVVESTNVSSVSELEVLPGASVTVYLGEHKLSSATETDIARQFAVSSVVVHPSGSDIALVQLAGDGADISVYTPVCLPERSTAQGGPDYRGDTAVVTGWGVNVAAVAQDPAATTSDTLQELQLSILNNFDCSMAMLDAFDTTYSNVLCFGGGSTGACFGDSGGPVVVEGSGGQWGLAGVISAGFGGEKCATPGTTGLAVEVAGQSILNFIRGTATGGEACDN